VNEQRLELSHIPFPGAAALTGAAACWGIATVMTKALLTSFPPLTLLTIQLTANTLLLWLLVIGTGQALPRYRDVLHVGWLGLLNPGISYTLSLLGLSITTASMSTLLWASEPVFIIGLAWVLLREQLTSNLLILAAIALCGVLLISFSGDATMATGSFTGNLLILGGVLCCALYTVLAQRTQHIANPLVAVTLQQTFALLMALTILPLETLGTDGGGIVRIDRTMWFWAIVTGIIYYALAFWFYLQGLARTRATVAGIFVNLIPLFGISAAYLILGERLTPLQWLGATVIIGAVFLLLWRQDHMVAEASN